jgi:hypothetical protein
MKRLLREMGEAINDSLSTSDELNGTIDRIRQEGYEIFLILEATIGLNPKTAAGGGTPASRTLPAASIEITEGTGLDEDDTSGVDGGNELVFQVSPDDEQFLRSLRISVDDSGSRSAGTDAGHSGPDGSEDGDGEE